MWGAIRRLGCGAAVLLFALGALARPSVGAEPEMAVKMSLGSNEGRSLGPYWVAISPDGTRLAYRTGVDTIGVFAADTRKLLNTVTISEKSVGELLDFSGDGKRLILRSMRMMRAIDPQTGKIERSAGKEDKFDIYTHTFAWDNEASRIVSCSTNFNFNNNPPVRFWDATTNTMDGEVTIGPNGGSRGLAVSGDGRRVATSASSHRKAQPTDESAEEYVEIWDSRTRKRIARVHLGNGVQPGTVHLNRDGTTLLTWDTVGRWTLWDVTTQGKVAELGRPDGFDARVTFSPDDKKFAVQTRGREGVGTYVYDTMTGKRLHEGKMIGNRCAGVGFTAKGNILACAVDGTLVRVSNVTKADPAPAATPEGHQRPVFFTRFADDGKSILTVGGDGRILKWDAATGKVIDTVLDHAGPRSLLWNQPCVVSPDGKWMVLHTGRYTLIDLEKKTDVCILENRPNHYSTWERFDFSEDGKMLYARGTGQETGRTDFKIVVRPFVASWRLEDGKLLADHLGETRESSLDDLFRTHFGKSKLAVAPSNGKLTVTIGAAVRDPWASEFNAGPMMVGHNVTIKETGSGKVRFNRTMPTNGDKGFSISPDGKRVAVPLNDGTVAILE